ncbi:MAG TPA: dihydroorotase [Anaerovoracaceae bacterium]|nr:dihydroorotase [Anaerovoracaceae bacterium]
MRLFISNGLIVDPENNLESMGDLMIEDGIIKEISLYRNRKQQQDTSKDRIQNMNTAEDIHLDVQGKWIVPGLIDLHVHLREPGFEYKEDIESGCRSAAKGGFTTICCMPNTSPVIDCSYVVLMIDSIAQEGIGVQVQCIGAVTKGQEGKELADYEGMIQTGSHAAQLTGKGICGISEDGKTVQDSSLMSQAMKKAKKLGLTVFSHAEPEAEIVERDLALAEAAGCRLHFCHISEKRSIELIREAKKRGVQVTAETAPHYFTLNTGDVNGDTNKKMNPPLRQKQDVEAVKQALKDGTIDVIATDHAPHHEREKSLPFDDAPNGVIGLETSFPVSYTNLVRTGVLTPLELISKMSSKPAEILGINRGSLWIGKSADLTIIDVEQEYEILPETFLSKGKNSPFLGEKVFGQTAYTIIGGQIIWSNENL